MPADDAIIKSGEGRQLVEEVFTLIDRKSFDPAYRRAESEGSKERLLAQAAQPGTRGDWARRTDEALKGTGMSQLRLLGPAAVRRQRVVREPSPAAREESISGRKTGNVGILRIGSFLVPAIRREHLEKAFAEVEGSPALLLELRGNPGGTAASTAWVMEYLAGPDVVVSRFRFCNGAGKVSPLVQRGLRLRRPERQRSRGPRAERGTGFVELRTRVDAPPAFAGPVFLLVDGECASSCEEFAAAMQDHHVAKVLGTPTARELLAGVAYRPSWRGHLREGRHSAAQTRRPWGADHGPSRQQAADRERRRVRPPERDVTLGSNPQ